MTAAAAASDPMLGGLSPYRVLDALKMSFTMPPARLFYDYLVDEQTKRKKTEDDDDDGDSDDDDDDDEEGKKEEKKKTAKEKEDDEGNDDPPVHRHHGKLLFSSYISLQLLLADHLAQAMSLTSPIISQDDDRWEQVTFQFFLYNLLYHPLWTDTASLDCVIKHLKISGVKFMGALNAREGLEVDDLAQVLSIIRSTTAFFGLSSLSPPPCVVISGGEEEDKKQEGGAEEEGTDRRQLVREGGGPHTCREVSLAFSKFITAHPLQEGR